MRFRITGRDRRTDARTADVELAHGHVHTPVFMPVGTNATVKAVPVEDLEDMGVRIILANAYHLYLRPGTGVIGAAGGLHSFMAWKGNILTDSGGFQIFSLAPFRRIESEGVFFRSHIDGSGHALTPESVVGIQLVLGSDVMMPLDVCTPYGVPREQAISALEITTEWAVRSLAAWRSAGGGTAGGTGAGAGGTAGGALGELFGIVQGNFYPDLRRRSAEELCAMDFPGYALGGLSVGEEFSAFIDMLGSSSGLLPTEKPRYLMGIGSPDFILAAVEAGIDLFDCVYPTRIARNALAMTRLGPLNLRLAKNERDQRPIDPECGCSTCRRFSRSYLRHMFKCKEIMGAVLATHHNLFFIQDLMAGIRRSIDAGRFSAFKHEFLDRYTRGEP